MLPSTTVGTLEFRAIQEPVRTIKGISYRQATCTGIDFENKVVTGVNNFTNDEFNQEYDKLVIACGMRSRTFSTPGISE
jgi:NADH dehydrogenase FAD-containing subunit